MTETYNISGEPVDYQDRMAKRMTREEISTFRTGDGFYELRFSEAEMSDAFNGGFLDAIDCMLEIVDEENNLSKLAEETPLGCGLNDTLAKNIKDRVMALKGDINHE